MLLLFLLCRGMDTHCLFSHMVLLVDVNQWSCGQVQQCNPSVPLPIDRTDTWAMIYERKCCRFDLIFFFICDHVAFSHTAAGVSTCPDDIPLLFPPEFQNVGHPLTRGSRSCGTINHSDQSSKGHSLKGQCTKKCVFLSHARWTRCTCHNSILIHSNNWQSERDLHEVRLDLLGKLCQFLPCSKPCIQVDTITHPFSVDTCPSTRVCWWSHVLDHPPAG